MSYNRIMSQGKQALAAGQLGLTTTAKNVSNVNTPGYSRQRTEQVAEEPQDYGHLRIGGGVNVNSITRASSQFINKRLEQENTSLGKFQGVQEIYQQLESVFKDEGEMGILPGVTQFFNDVRTLSTQPDAIPLRTAVRESGDALSRRFQSTASSLSQIVTDLDRRIDGNVQDINALTRKIATLNKQIVDVEVQGPRTIANDERDARDLAVQNLSKLVDVRVTQEDNGSISVTAGRIGSLVAGTDAQELRALRSNDGPTAGNVRVFLVNPYVNSKPSDVTDSFEGGSLAGYVQARDEVIPRYRDRLDKLAFGIITEVNGAHRESYGLRGEKGKDFFQDPGSIQNAASGFSVSEAIKLDVANIGAADSPNAAGDNRGLLRLGSVEDKAFFDGGKAKIGDVVSTIVGSVGSELRAVNDNYDIQKGMVDQLTTFQQQVSGVSLDEEAMNMLSFQKAFDAGAKMIQVADSMMETVLNLKRF